MTCTTCGHVLAISEWPFCPHGVPLSVIGIIDDQLEGGPRRFETMGHDAPFISSKSQWRREVAARGLVCVNRHDRAYLDKRLKMRDERRRDEA